MLETIAGTCRVLACDGSLLILYHLSGERELTSTELSRRAKLPRDQTSAHLSRLATVGGVHRRRSGSRVYYAIGNASKSGWPFDPWGTVERVFAGLPATLKGWDAEGNLHLSPRTLETVERRVAAAMDMVFDASTAFTNVRRLLVLQMLKEKGECTAGSVVANLKMSEQACWRHLDKLVRRGYVRERSAGVWVISRNQRTRCHAEMLGTVLAWLGG
ncbi:MAG: ArsR family transcriptional regulator [Planctomycetes bacterium]|nr:ArsR family transcriptional regulator [Planctomycetota bacterium]